MNTTLKNLAQRLRLPVVDKERIELMDRWVYSNHPREVKGDADALVCVVDRSSYFSGYDVSCCQIKNLGLLFDYAKKREELFGKGLAAPMGFEMVDDQSYMDVVASLKPDMWKRITYDGRCADYVCTYREGITKENFAECCNAYNKHKGLKCEFDED